MFYKGREVGKHRLDFLVEGKLILELKAVSELTDAFRKQTTSYLKATKHRLGILVNFSAPSVEYERIAN